MTTYEQLMEALTEVIVHAQRIPLTPFEDPLHQFTFSHQTFLDFAALVEDTPT